MVTTANDWSKIDQTDIASRRADERLIAERLAALGRSSFRAKFELGPKERAYLEAKGAEVIRAHAYDLIGKRLAPAKPARDGKQTPWRGHPVFVAQHATATCCRGCLERWHGITKGQELTAVQRDYVVAVIMAWVLR
jgi:hypothetical protein